MVVLELTLVIFICLVFVFLYKFQVKWKNLKTMVSFIVITYITSVFIINLIIQCCCFALSNYMPFKDIKTRNKYILKFTHMMAFSGAFYSLFFPIDINYHLVSFPFRFL